MYMKWKEDLRAELKGSNNEGDGENLCRRLDSEAIAFAGKLVELYTERAGPYFKYYMGYEFVDPLMRRTGDQKRGQTAALKHLCTRFELRFADMRAQHTEIKNKLVASATAADRASAADNLLTYFNVQKQADPVFWAERPVATKFIARVFATAVSSAFVEPLFSLMSYGTGDRRSSTSMATFAGALYCRGPVGLSADSADAATAGHFAARPT